MILEGKGYTSIDGVKHTWKKGDVLNLPLRARHHRAALQHRLPSHGEIRRHRAELVRSHLRRPRLRLRAAGRRAGTPSAKEWMTSAIRTSAHAAGRDSARACQRRSSRERIRQQRAAGDPARRRADAEARRSPPTLSCASPPTAAAASWCGSIRPLDRRPRHRHRAARPLRAAGAEGASQRRRSRSRRPTLGRSSASSSIPPSTSRSRMISCRISNR